MIMAALYVTQYRHSLDFTFGSVSGKHTVMLQLLHTNCLLIGSILFILQGTYILEQICIFKQNNN